MKKKALFALLVASLMALSGCTTDGDGNDDEADDGHGHGDEGTLPYTGSEDRQIEVHAGSPDEFRFYPDSLTAHHGESIGVTFTNDGEIPHEFAIADLDFRLHAEPGQTVQGAFVVPEHGVEFACHIPGHYESGMKGQMEVGA